MTERVDSTECVLSRGTSWHVDSGAQKRDAAAVLLLYIEKLGTSVLEEGKSTGAMIR